MHSLSLIAVAVLGALYGLAWHDQPAKIPEKTSLPEIPAMPIFDPRTCYTHRVSKVQREIALAQYEKAIPCAFREDRAIRESGRAVGFVASIQLKRNPEQESNKRIMYEPGFQTSL